MERMRLNELDLSVIFFLLLLCVSFCSSMAKTASQGVLIVVINVTGMRCFLSNHIGLLKVAVV